MKVFGGRVSGVTALAVVVLLLVPALAWLQYRWVGQVSAAERDRMQRTLRTSAAQFATAFDTEVSRAVASLQVESAVVRDENWSLYAERYSDWTERTADARLVRDVLLVDATDLPVERAVDSATLRLRRWNHERQTFDLADWSGDVAGMRTVLADHLTEMRAIRAQGNARFRRESTFSLALSDPYTFLSPVTRVEFGSDRSSGPRIDVLGFTLIRLDADYIRGTLLPTLAARHFHGDDEAGEYRVAVTDREKTAVIWESEAGAAAAVGTAPDVEQPFMSPRPDQIFMIARNARSSMGGPSEPRPAGDRIVVSVLEDRRDGAGDRTHRPGTPPPEGSRAFSPFEGRWRVVASHRAGSLEAAVAAVRTRNLMLSSGILLLLTAAIGLIVVSARRAQTLARQQMEFVAAVSHELRTPVAVIGTAAGNLADGVVADPARVRKYGETIQGEARRLGETVERVLQLAGIAAGSNAAARGQVAVADLVQQSLAACRPEIDAQRATIETAIADDLPAVSGDLAALRSALQNLMTNAVKYGGDPRWIRVSAVPSDRAGAPVTGHVASHVAIAVSDRGLGIGAEDRRHIFEPFYRGREAVARQIQGSGLGLNLVSRIAEAHGGTVQVTSEPGKGSTFTLVLPAARATPAGVDVGLVPTKADVK